MSIIDFIEKIREKPEETRRKITLVTVILFMFAIGSLWVARLDSMFRSDIEEENDNSAEVMSNSPFSFIKEKISDVTAIFVDSLDGINLANDNADIYIKEDNIDKE